MNEKAPRLRGFLFSKVPRDQASGQSDALAATFASGRVTFFSRTTGRLWTKGETSGNHLVLQWIDTDCDGDSLLVRARPAEPTCHLGSTSCFPGAPANFLGRLVALVQRRERERPAGSYTTSLFAAGLPRMAQKVGEEGVETSLAAVVGDDDALLGEAADLLFHIIVMLRARGLSLKDSVAVLEQRHRV